MYIGTDRGFELFKGRDSAKIQQLVLASEAGLPERRARRQIIRTMKRRIKMMQGDGQTFSDASGDSDAFTNGQKTTRD
jgi:hypothetical protein